MMVSPMASSMPSPTWDDAAVIALTEEPLETEQTTELAAFIDDVDFSAVFEDDDNTITTKDEVEEVDRSIFWPVGL